MTRMLPSTSSPPEELALAPEGCPDQRKAGELPQEAAQDAGAGGRGHGALLFGSDHAAVDEEDDDAAQKQHVEEPQPHALPCGRVAREFDAHAQVHVLERLFPPLGDPFPCHRVEEAARD